MSHVSSLYDWYLVCARGSCYHLCVHDLMTLCGLTIKGSDLVWPYTAHVTDELPDDLLLCKKCQAVAEKGEVPFALKGAGEEQA